MNKTPYHIKSAIEILNELGTKADGLGTASVSERLVQYGRNELTAKRRIPKWITFLSQFKDVLVILLMVATGMSFLIGNINNAIIMSIIVLINAFIGYYQEN